MAADSAAMYRRMSFDRGNDPAGVHFSDLSELQFQQLEEPLCLQRCSTAVSLFCSWFYA